MSCRYNLFLFLIVWIASASMALPALATPLLFSDPVAWEEASAALFTITPRKSAAPALPGDSPAPEALFLGGMRLIPLLGPLADHPLYILDPDGPATGGPSPGMLPAGARPNSAGWASPVFISLSTGDMLAVPPVSWANGSGAGLPPVVPIASTWVGPGGSRSPAGSSSGGLPAVTIATSEIDTMILAGAGLLGLWLSRKFRRWAS